jgi:hypothetical protein
MKKEFHIHAAHADFQLGLHPTWHKEVPLSSLQLKSKGLL